ncbi:hypothetical protein QTP88_004973 [Uroleucon formosanum]
MYIIRLEFRAFFSLRPVFVANRNIPYAPHAHHIYYNHSPYTWPLINLFFYVCPQIPRDHFNEGYRKGLTLAIATSKLYSQAPLRVSTRSPKEDGNTIPPTYMNTPDIRVRSAVFIPICAVHQYHRIIKKKFTNPLMQRSNS